MDDNDPFRTESEQLETLWMAFVVIVCDRPEDLPAYWVWRVMKAAWNSLDGGKFDRFRAWLASRVSGDLARAAVENWMPDHRGGY